MACTASWRNDHRVSISRFTTSPGPSAVVKTVQQWVEPTKKEYRRCIKPKKKLDLSQQEKKTRSCQVPYQFQRISSAWDINNKRMLFLQFGLSTIIFSWLVGRIVVGLSTTIIKWNSLFSEEFQDSIIKCVTWVPEDREKLKKTLYCFVIKTVPYSYQLLINVGYVWCQINT